MKLTIPLSSHIKTYHFHDPVSLIISSFTIAPPPQIQNDSGDLVAADLDPELLQELADQPTGMQDTELRSMKDQLLIETSEMLGVGTSVCMRMCRQMDRVFLVWVAQYSTWPNCVCM